MALMSQKFVKTVNIEASSITPAQSSGPSIALAESSGSSVAPTVAASGSSVAPAAQAMMIRANHFLLNLADNDLLHYYDVTISPEVLSRAVNRTIINELVKIYGKSYLGNKMPAYDGRKSLYTAGALPFTSKDFVVKLPEDKVSAKKEKYFTVTIKIAGRADLERLPMELKYHQTGKENSCKPIVGQWNMINKVYGPDNRGLARGVSHVSKTQLKAAKVYRDQLLGKKAAGSSRQAASSSPDPPPRVLRSDCILKDYHGTVAVGIVVDAVAGLPSHQKTYNVKLKSIYMPDTDMFVTQEGGEVVQWPASLVEYI